ncbi:MAG: C1 family peptidase [Ferruginibacter sp.]
MNFMFSRSLFIILTGMFCIAFTVAKAQNNRQYFTGDNTDESEFNKISKSARRATRDLENLPPIFSIKQYAPVPLNQGSQGTCVAWSTAYAARTISYCIQRQYTDPEKIKATAFSPNYLYYYVKMQGDSNCVLGAKIEPALKILMDKGDLLFSESLPDCVVNMDTIIDKKAKNNVIKAYTSLTTTFGRITKNEVITIKKSISEKKPVIFSLKCFKSLFKVGADGVWAMDQNDENISNHAVCIVGYDDNKFGGAFEVMNSWGTDWGNKGFFWLTYDQIMKYGAYALELMDREVYDVNKTRGIKPEIKGNIDFVLTNDFGNDVAIMPVLRSNAGPSVLSNDNKPFAEYSLVEKYPAGQKFKIKFTTNAPAFVYIFALDDKQMVSTLFPYAANISPAINSTDATVYLPSEAKHYKLNGDASRDKICVLYSKTALDFDNLKSKISIPASDIYEVIKTLYKERLIPVKNISFKDDKINFSSLAAEQELLCFFIDLNHT